MQLFTPFGSLMGGSDNPDCKAQCNSHQQGERKELHYVRMSRRGDLGGMKSSGGEVRLGAGTSVGV